MFDNQSNKIKAVIYNYFEGIYNGNPAQLEEVFHPKSHLFGDINGAPYFKSVTEYIDGVKNRKSPKELGEKFNMEILSIDIIGNNAIIKANLKMLGFNYYDLLSLTNINGHWKIVTKLFTHVA
jgi:hypothetical protein